MNTNFELLWSSTTRDVRIYVRTYMSVTFRNINLQSRLECQFSLMLRNSGVTDTCICSELPAVSCIQHLFLHWTPPNMYVVKAKPHCPSIAKKYHSPHPAQLILHWHPRVKNAKKSVHCRSQESKKRTRKTKEKNHILESLHKPCIRLILLFSRALIVIKAQIHYILQFFNSSSTIVLYCPLGSH